jgi:hypothetical protein
MSGQKIFRMLLPPMENSAIEERMVIKIRGPLVDMLVDRDQEMYAPFIINEASTNVLYV